MPGIGAGLLASVIADLVAGPLMHDVVSSCERANTELWSIVTRD